MQEKEKQENFPRTLNLRPWGRWWKNRSQNVSTIWCLLEAL